MGQVIHDVPCAFPVEDDLGRDVNPELLSEEMRLQGNEMKLISFTAYLYDYDRPKCFESPPTILYFTP